MKRLLSVALIILTSLMLFSCSKLTMKSLEEKLEKEEFEIEIEDGEMALRYLRLDIEEQYNLEFEGEILEHLFATGHFKDSSGEYDCEFEAIEFENEKDAKKYYNRMLKEVGEKFVKIEGTLVVRSSLDRALKLFT